MSKPTYQQVHIDVALTNISVAYKPGAFIADQIFPAIPVQKISGKFFIYNKQDWLRDEAALLAAGTRAQRGGYAISTGTYTCLQYAFGQGVPDQIADNADSPLSPLTDATEFVTTKLLLKQEVDVAADVFGSSIWSGSATPSVVWSNDTSDPLGDIETGVNSIAATIFQEPNVGVVGRGVFRYLKNHPDVVDRIKYSAGPNSPAIVTVNAIAALGGLEKLLVGTAGKETANEGAATSLSNVWGSHMWIGYVTPRASLLTPSAGYIFTYQQRQVERFREDQEHQNVVTCSAYWDSNTTATDAGYLLKSVV